MASETGSHCDDMWFFVLIVTGGKHELVPADIKAEAVQLAKEAIKDSDSEDDD